MRSVNEYLNQEVEVKLPTKKQLKNFGKNGIVDIHKHNYTTFKIIPDMEVENNSNMFIAKSLHGMYKMFSERWNYNREELKIDYRPMESFFYDIVITNSSIDFYLSVPSTKVRTVKPTLDNVWSKCAINEIKTLDTLKFDLNKTSAGLLKTLKHNYFSLVTDKRENTPLSHILENQKNLIVGEKIRINICCQPVNKGDWEDKVSEAKKTIRQGKTPEKMMIDKKYIARKGLEGVHVLFEDAYEFATLFTQGDVLENKTNAESRYEMHRARMLQNEIIGLNAKIDKDDYTVKKQNQDVFITDIRLLVETETKDKNEMILKSLLNNYNTMAGDNEFTLKRVYNIQGFYSEIKNFKMKFNPITTTMLSLDEVSKLIMLPTRALQEEFSMQKIDSREIGVSLDLISKGIGLGEVSLKGKTEKVGFGEDEDSNSKPVIYLSEQGGGKTSGAIIYTHEALKRGETVIVPDVADGDLINDTINYLPNDFPEDHIIVLDYSHPEHIIPLGWNEINLESLEGREAMKIANFLTQQIKHFLDTLSNEPLSDRMREYLSSAGRLVFRHNDSTIVDLMRCLTDYDTRHKFIKRSGLTENNRLIQQMLSLDTSDEGTKLSRVDGIIDRMSVLLSDANLELILSQKPNLEIDFGKWLNDKSSKYGYFVGVRIPKAEFLAETTDTMVTMLVSKIWLATLFSRNTLPIENRKQAHLILDEPHQYEQVMKFIKSAIKESRKWRLRFVMLTHTFDVFSNMKEDLLSAGCSYIMMKTTEKNFKTIQNVVKPFSIEDMVNLKQYHALCSINYKNVNHNFIAKLSPPPSVDKKNYTFKNRMYLYDKCAKKYGKKFVWEE